MDDNHVDRINQAIAKREFVRIRRRFDHAFVHGYVLASGSRHFVMAVVDDRLWYDGFECYRLKDVQSVEADPHAAFAESALRLRGQRKPRLPRLDLESAQTLLESAGALYPLVTIHREKVEPDVCHIGRVVGTSEKRVTLLEIGPDAQWDEAEVAYPIKGITRVDFGGGYEDALALVGGTGPGHSRSAGRPGADRYRLRTSS
jgi:hypothetical protein